MSKLYAVVLLLPLIGATIPALAAGESQFGQGVTLFKQGQYKQALAKFTAAKEAGMREPKLDFNLALCQLKLEHYEAAKAGFLAAAKHLPLKSLSHFNIGMLELARGQRDEATTWFQRVYDETKDAKLKALAALKLKQVKMLESKAEKGVWTTGYSVSLGYDDNIIDPAQLGISNRGDGVSTLMLYAAGVENVGSNEGLHLGVIGYLQQYQTVKIYDLQLLQLSLAEEFQVADWDSRAGFSIETSSLGGKPYLATTKLDVFTRKALSNNRKMHLQYRYSDFDSLATAHDHLKGHRHELEAHMDWSLDEMDIQLGYEYEINDRRDYVGATTFSSYSPTRHTLDIHLDKELSDNLKLSGRGSLRISEYSKKNILPDTTRIRRSDTRVLFSADLTYALRRDIELKLEYKFSDNYTNIASYGYTRNLYTIGLSGKF